jgi:hypothetical protein
MLEINKSFIPCVWILGFLHAQEMHDHPIDELYFSISLRVEGSGFGNLDIQQRLEA